MIGERVRRERRWTPAGETSARELDRSTPRNRVKPNRAGPSALDVYFAHERRNICGILRFRNWHVSAVESIGRHDGTVEKGSDICVGRV